jgi:hypothetical protein
MKMYIEPGGMLVVAFSGHGVERQSDNKVFLLPADASSNPDDYEESAISVDRVKELIKQTSASQVMLLLDSCRNDPTAGRGTEDNKLTKSYAAAFNNLKGGGVKAFATLYAASEGQRAWEFQEKKQGYFSWAFVEGLKGAARDSSTGEVTLDGLTTYVANEVERRARMAGKSQRPWFVKEGYGEKLVISKVAPPPPPAPKVVSAPAPVLPTTGVLSVVSEPGAQVVVEPLTGDKSLRRQGTIVEGRAYSSGPLPFGSYRVTVTREGFLPETKPVEIAAGNLNHVLPLPLKAATYTVTVRTNISKGRVELGARGEALRVYPLQGGQAVAGELHRGEYSLRIIPDDVGFQPKDAPLTVEGDLTLDYRLESKVRTKPLDANFNLPEQWQLPSAWRGTRVLEVNGEGRSLLRDDDNWFTDLELSANVELIGGTSVSFIVRAVDEQNYYLVRLCGPRSDTPNNLRVFLVKDGQKPRHLQTFSLSDFRLTDQFLFGLKATGSHFEFLIDDNSGTGKRVGLSPVGTLTDATFRAGTVGVAAGSGDKAKLYQYYVCPGSCPKN